MLIVLDVQKNESRDILSRIKALLHPYEIVTRVKKQNKVTVLYIRYISNRGRIRFKKIYEYAVGAPKTILCSKELQLEDTPFKRFESSELNKCLMQNFILSILRDLGSAAGELRLGFYDPMAENPELAEKLLKEVPKLSVVSNMPRFYERESERLVEQLGAPLLVSNSPEQLSHCDVVICPDKIEQHLPVSEQALIFTAEKPSVSLKGTVISEYFPEFPYRFDRLKPKSVDDVYFLSALYSLCGVRELSSLLPRKCGDGSVLYSRERLVQRLIRLRSPDEICMTGA